MVRQPLRASTTSVCRDIPLKECFDRFLPEAFRMNRDYFTGNGRSLGKDAFHKMWFMLFREFYPSAVTIARLPGQPQLAREVNQIKCTEILGEGSGRVLRDFGI